MTTTAQVDYSREWAAARQMITDGTVDEVLGHLADMAVIMVETTDCSYCGAKPSQPCFWLPGQIAQVTHFERIEVAWL